MNNVDNELFELCKEVFKRTSWHDKSLKSWTRDWNTNGFYGEPRVSTLEGNQLVKEDGTGTPLYTSDYLLEKLQRQGLVLHYEIVGYGNKLWYAEVTQGVAHRVADTPLKALLKLAIALDDAGIKL